MNFIDKYMFEVNEYIEHQDEVMNHLEAIQDDMSINTVVILDDGCKMSVIRRIKAEIENMGVTVQVECKGA